MAKSKTCLGCNQIFAGRKDAKTCSVRCRKRLERHKRLLTLELRGNNRFDTFVKSPSAVSSEEYIDYQPRRLAKSALKKSSGVSKWKSLIILLLFSLIGVQMSHASALSEGYVTSDSGLKTGMVVALTDGGTAELKSVKRADYKDANFVVGISTDINSSLIAAVPFSSQVLVATNGQAETYVSDINGDVKRGDRLSLSPLAGILMKNTLPSEGIAGTALADLPSSAQTTDIKDAGGKTMHSKIAKLPVKIEITTPPATSSGSWLSQIGRYVTGREVSQIRVLAALLIFSVLLIVEGSLVHSIITNSLSAIGRNPLASSQVRLQALRSFGFALFILMLGGTAITIIMWL